MTARSIEPIYLSDAEIAHKVNLTAAEWKAVAILLEPSGLPRRDPLFKNKRCWPVVREFLYRRAGGVSLKPDAIAKSSARSRSSDA